MPHPGADRPRKTRDRADEGLVVERPELLRRAAAARDDHRVEVAYLREPVERGDQRLDRADALDLRGREHELDAGIAPRHDVLDVTPDRPDRARDDAETPRRRRKGALAFAREETLLGEAALERLQAQIRVSGPGRTQVVDAELASSVAQVELDVAVREKLRPVPGHERKLRRLGREEHALQLSDVVAEREVHVSGRRHTSLVDLALNPQVLERVVALDALGELHRELADAEDAARRARDTHRSACRP